MTVFSYIHIGSALLSYLSAFAVFTRPVGTRSHRMIGITYAVAMLTTALAGFFIYTTGKPTLFHVFSVVTVLTISRGWWAILKFRKTRDRAYLKRHYFNMAYSFMGLNLAAIAQATRFLHFSSFTEYLTTVIGFYVIAVALANWLIRKVLYRRFAPWFGANVQPAE